MAEKEHSRGILAANKENSGERIPSLFPNATPNNMWPKGPHHWGLNCSASCGSWVWSHLISSRKVHLNLHFHTDRVNMNNSCVEAGFEWLAQPIWMLLFQKRMCLIVWKQPLLTLESPQESVKGSSLNMPVWKDNCVPVFPPRSSLLCLYGDVSPQPSLSPGKTPGFFSIYWHPDFRA